MKAASTTYNTTLMKYALIIYLTGSKRNTSLNFCQENNNVFLLIRRKGSLNSLNPLNKNKYLIKKNIPRFDDNLAVGNSKRNVPGILAIITTSYRMFKLCFFLSQNCSRMITPISTNRLNRFIDAIGEDWGITKRSLPESKHKQTELIHIHAILMYLHAP